MATKQEVKDYYDVHTIVKLKNYVYGNLRVDRATEAIKALAPGPRQHILDIGCGIGQVAMKLANHYQATAVYGFDISEKSIELASKLFGSGQIKFARADTLMEWKLAPEIQFDLIVLMDVYEHIPLNERPGLHAILRDRLAPGGTLFISCPTPAFLAWLKIHDPANIQPVDEDIDLPVLQVLASETGTTLKYFEERKVWRSGDYLYAAFNKLPFGYDAKEPKAKPGLTQRIWLKIQRTIYSKAKAEQQKRKQHIAQRTGLVV